MSEVRVRRAVQPSSGVLAAQVDVGRSFVVATAVVVTVLTTAAQTGWRPLRTGPSAGLVLVVVVLAVALLVVAARRGRRRDRQEAHDGEGSRRWALVPAAPALVVVAYAVAAFLLPYAQRVEWFLNGDHPRHVVHVEDIQRYGALSYEAQIYPRAWHSLVALLWAVGPGTPTTPDVLGLVSFMATLTWLLSGLLALATASLTVTLAGRLGLGGRAALLAGTGAGALTLWPWFFGNYQALGLESSIVAAVVLAVCIREVLDRPDSVVALVVCVSGLVVMANTWQLLLPVSLILVGWVAVGVVRRSGARGLALAGGLVVAASLVSAPSMTAVTTRVGVGHATDADVVAPLPTAVLLVALACLVALSFLFRRDLRVLLVASLVVLPAVTGVVLAWRLGLTVTTYYPAKLLWHTALLGTTAIAVVFALAVERLGPDASGRVRPVARAWTVAAVAGATAGALYGPLPALLGSWSTVDGQVVVALAGAPEAEDAVVVWSGAGSVDDAVTRILLDAYRPAPGRVGAGQEPTTLDEECALLAAAERPVVLTARSEAETRARYDCAPEARVITP